MGYYFNPPAQLPSVGRRLEDGNYEQLVAQLGEGEHLYGLYQRNDAGFSNAPHLFSKDELQAFSEQAATGRITFQGYFALSADQSGSPYATQVNASAGLAGSAGIGRSYGSR